MSEPGGGGGEVDAGSVAVEVVPDATGFAQKLRDALVPDADRVGIEVGRALSDRIQEALGDIRISVDTLQAHGDLDELTARLDEMASTTTRHEVDIEDLDAHAKLDELQARLDELGSTTTRHRVEIDRTGSTAGAGAGGGLSLLGVGLSLLPAAIPLVASLVPILVGVGMAGIGAAAGVGVLALAFHGIGPAVQALGKQTAETAQQQAQYAASQLASTDAVLNAQDAVTAAVQGAADARRSAALSVASAEHGVLTAEQALASAQYSETQAQINLTLARKQAAQTLQDLSNQVADGALTQRQATLDLAKAQQTLTVVDFNPHSTSQQRAEAQLAVDQAKQHLSEVELANTRLAAQKQQADKLGVSQAPAVVAAEHAAAQATQSRQNAQYGLVTAQAAAVEAQRAGAEQIQKADLAIIQSQRGLEQAYASAGAQGNSAANAVAAAMANLSPAGQAFARFVNDKLRPGLKELSGSAQSAFLPGLQSAIASLLPYLPNFAAFIATIGHVLGDLAERGAKALTQPFWKDFFGFIGQSAGPWLNTFVTIIGNLATGLAGLFEALAPAGNSAGVGFESFTKRFAEWGTHLGTNNGFQKFLDYLRTNGPKVGQFLENLARLLGKLIIAFAPMGGAIIQLITKLAGALDRLSPGQLLALGGAVSGLAVGWKAFQALKAVEGITDFGRALATLSKSNLILLAITTIVAGLVYAYTHFKTFRDIVNEVMRDIGIAATWLWVNVLKPTFTWIVDHWHYVATALKFYWDFYLHPMFDVFATVVKFLWNDVAKPTFTFIADHWHLVATAMSATYDDVLKPIWSKLTGAFDAVSKGFGQFRDGLSTIWTDIQNIFADGYNFVTQKILNKFIKAINDITGLLGIPKLGTIDPITIAVSSGHPAINGPGGHAPTKFAHGGVVPGYAPGLDIVHALVSPGEGILVPEAVRGLGGASAVEALNKQFSNRPASSDGRHFAGGIGSVIGGIARSGADTALDGAELPIKQLINHLSPKFVKDMAQGGFNSIDGAVRHWIKAHTSGGQSLGEKLSDATHQVLIRTALQLAKVADTPGNEADVNLIVNAESGWNPKAINLTDSNALAGHPSQGLMQTIASTFAAYRLAALPDDITNPLANLVAGIRYAVARYGALDDVPGVAAVHAGGPYVGYDSGGYLPPGISNVYNGTGRPEPVFTDTQWAAMTAAGAGSARGGDRKLADHLTIVEAGSPAQTAQEVQRLLSLTGAI